MPTYVVYDNSGEILRSVVCPASMAALQPGPGERVIAGQADDTEQYVNNGQIVARPAMPYTLNKTEFLADGVDSIIITDLPYGVTVYVDGEPFFVNDAVFEFTAALPGPYTVEVEGIPYKPTKFEVTAS